MNHNSTQQLLEIVQNAFSTLQKKKIITATVEYSLTSFLPLTMSVLECVKWL